MQAELHGKLDVERSAAARLEDTLSDAVFSTFRYLDPTSVLASFLRSTFPDVLFHDSDLKRAQIEFWPRLSTGTEPDVVITVGRWLVIIEAKYRSGFGIDADGTHQLEREWFHGLQHAQARRLSGPLLVAVTDDPRPPPDLSEVRGHLEAPAGDAAELGASSVLRWMSWQTIAKILELARPSQPRHGQELIDDVLALMKARGVSRMFEGFNRSEYWLVAAAHEAAHERIYPAISELNHELLALLHEDDISWGAADAGAWMYFSRQRDKPSEWPLSYITLPFWPDAWPNRSGTQSALVCTFSLVEPVISVGYVQIARNYADSAKHWAAISDELASALGTLPENYEVAADDSHGYQKNTRVASEVDSTWLAEGMRSARSLWIVQRFGVEEFTSAETARRALVETRDLVEDRPILFESLKAAGLAV